jgi:hypothetical protein
VTCRDKRIRLWRRIDRDGTGSGITFPEARVLTRATMSYHDYELFPAALAGEIAHRLFGHSGGPSRRNGRGGATRPALYMMSANENESTDIRENLLDAHQKDIDSVNAPRAYHRYSSCPIQPYIAIVRSPVAPADHIQHQDRGPIRAVGAASPCHPRFGGSDDRDASVRRITRPRLGLKRYNRGHVFPERLQQKNTLRPWPIRAMSKPNLEAHATGSAH